MIFKVSKLNLFSLITKLLTIFLLFNFLKTNTSELQFTEKLSININSLFSIIFLLIIDFIILFLGFTYNLRKIINFISALTFAIFFFILIGAIHSLDVIYLINQSFRLATPIALGAMAGIICERTGIINIAIEGMMLVGACIGYLVALYSGNLLLGVISASLSGLTLASLHAILSINYKADQIVSGTVINILAVGITGYIRRTILLQSKLSLKSRLPIIKVPFLEKIPILGDLLFKNPPTFYIAIIVIIGLHIALFKTKWGYHTRACGEHPRAADTIGINVNKLRFLNVLISGLIAGLAGAWFSLETTGSFEDVMTNGKGFIALAAMIFGKWKPFLASIGALLFGFADALQIKLQVFGINLPYQFLNMLPYIVTIIVLAGVIGRANPPSAIGVPYSKE